MRYLGISLVCIFGFLTSAQAQEAKPNFSGKWQLNTSKSQTPTGKASVSSLAIEHKDPSIHIVKTTSAGKTQEFTCTTKGSDCDAKAYKASLWYDAKSLVEMDVSDDQVLKISMSLSDDGKTLTAEVTYLSPHADKDTLVFDKN